jgi:hypothetical protein
MGVPPHREGRSQKARPRRFATRAKQLCCSIPTGIGPFGLPRLRRGGIQIDCLDKIDGVLIFRSIV